MGLHLFGSTSEGRTEPAIGDPDPKAFHILSAEHIGDFMLLEIFYPGATNYGGRKLALYRAAPWQVLQATRLDPHFSEICGPTVPIARFTPTDDGRTLARAVAKELQKTGDP